MPSTDGQWDIVGSRVREARTAAGISVRELARRIGVSASHVSQVERGIGSFSVPALYAVATELRVSMHDLIDPRDAEPAASSPSREEGVDLDADGIVQRVQDRPSITLHEGPRWSRLTTNAEPDAEFLEVVYAPTADHPADYIRHEGREYGIVISGTLMVEVDGKATALGEGDSIVFDSSRPHRFWNESGGEVRAIWFVRDRSPWQTAPHA
jgi:transcriptional regulator with XRE-family HTH domain